MSVIYKIQNSQKITLSFKMATSQSSPVGSLQSSFLYQKTQQMESCHQHNNQPITNFCANINCLKPLCPECIEQHYQYHSSIREKAQIHSFKSLRNNCMKKVLGILETIKDGGTEFDFMDSDSVYTQVLKTIKQVKQNVLKIVGDFFFYLQQQTVLKIKKRKQQRLHVAKQFNKINSIVQQLKLLSQKLDSYESESFLEYAKTIIKLNSKAVVQSVKQSYTYAAGMAQSQRKNLYLMRNYDKKLLKLLSNIISYGENDLKTLSRESQDNRNIGIDGKQRNSQIKHSRLTVKNEEEKQIKLQATFSNQNLAISNSKKSMVSNKKKDIESDSRIKKQARITQNQYLINIEQTRSADGNVNAKASDGSIKAVRSFDQPRILEKIRKTEQLLGKKHSTNLQVKQLNNDLWNEYKTKSPRGSLLPTKKYNDQLFIQSRKKNVQTYSSAQLNDEKNEKSQSRKYGKAISKRQKDISRVSFFNPNCQFKYLHFFQNDQNVVQFYDIEGAQPFIKFQVKSQFRIPQFHKSISVPDGNLFLIGGTYHETNKKSDAIMLYDFQTGSLKHVGKLLQGRSSHSICLGGDNRYIYILGGITSQDCVTATCQRFDLQKFKIEPIKPLNQAACSFSSCSFNQRYICKFGGVSENHALMCNIEIYDAKHGVWKVIEPQLPQSILKLLGVSTSAAVQVNSTEILVMGGYNQKNQGQSNSYFLRIEPPKKCEIVDINTFPLPFGQGFWASSPIIHNNQIFALQNITNYKDGDQCLQNARRVLIFDGKQWKSFN